jgi:hypothetical protein
VIVPAAMIADDLETRRRIIAFRRFFRATSLASLRRHHISLVESLLLFFGKNENFPALNTRDFYIRHRFFSIINY